MADGNSSPRDTNELMSVILVVGGQSESAYFRAVLPQSHPWAALDKLGVQVLSANGDSKIPLLVAQGRKDGKKVMVLYDRDALSRAHEQATVIEDEDVVTHELRSDFEASFDPEIVHAAITVLGYDAEIECLRQARSSGNTFAALETCAHATADAKPFGKVQLAEALGTVSDKTWYVPEEIYAAAVRLGELCDITPWADQCGWSKEATDSIEAAGRLYVSSHVSNDTVGYWDFERDAAGSISLPGTFDGRVAICRAGRRFVVRKFERDHAGSLLFATWVHVFDRGHDPDRERRAVVGS